MHTHGIFNSIPYHRVMRTKPMTLGYKLYKPDFFFYDQNGKLEKIVEIKSRNIDSKKTAIKALHAI